MKKTNFLLSLVIMTSFMSCFTDIAKCQTIINLNIYPPNPTSIDDIKLVSENMFTSGDCWIDSSSLIINGYDLQLETYFTTGALAVICTSYDTFQLGQLSDGTYQLHYNLRHPSSNPMIEDSMTIVFTVGAVGLSDKHDKNTGYVFPNPTKGKVFLNIPDLTNDRKLIFKVYSIQGQELKNMILNATKSEIQIDLSDLPAGYYPYEYHLKGSRDYRSGKLEIIKH